VPKQDSLAANDFAHLFDNDRECIADLEDLLTRNYQWWRSVSKGSSLLSRGCAKARSPLEMLWAIVSGLLDSHPDAEM